MQTTPSKSKRSLTFQSPSQSPSSKREIQIGYILDVTSILKKGSYYYIQFQNEENNAESLIVYNCKIHQSLQHFEGSGDPVKLQVLRQNDTLKVGSFCHVYQAFPSDVAFPLNPSLKENIKLESASKKITIGELKKIDPQANKEKFTVRARISMGDEEAEEISTSWGLKKLKRDIILQDLTGAIEFHIFTNRLEELKDGTSYEITGLTLNDFHGSYMSLSKESSITQIDAIQGLPAAVKKDPLTNEYTIQGFDSVKNEKVFYYCRSCKKEVLITESADWIRCTNIKCNTDLRTRNLKKHGSCEVNFMTGEENDMWATMFPNIIKKIIGGEVKSASQITEVVKKIEDCKVIVNKDVVVDLIFPQEEELNDKENVEDKSSVSKKQGGEEEFFSDEEFGNEVEV